MTLVSAARSSWEAPVVVVGVAGGAVVACVSLDEQHKRHKPIRTPMMVERTQPPTGTVAPTIFPITFPKEESKMLFTK